MTDTKKTKRDLAIIFSIGSFVLPCLGFAFSMIVVLGQAGNLSSIENAVIVAVLLVPSIVAAFPLGIIGALLARYALGLQQGRLPLVILWANVAMCLLSAIPTILLFMKAMSR